MCVDGRVSRGSREILVLSVRDVLVAAGVAVLLGQTKVDDVDQVALLPQAPVDIDKMFTSLLMRGHVRAM